MSCTRCDVGSCRLHSNMPSNQETRSICALNSNMMVHAGSMPTTLYRAEAHRYSLLSRYLLAKFTPMLASMPGVDTCTQAARG